MEILDDLMMKITEQKKDIRGMAGKYNGTHFFQECTNCRGIKLTSHTLKIMEIIMDERLRQETEIGKEQLGFMKGTGTTDGIFCLRQLMEKFRERQKDLHLVFIDLEKAHDRVPRQEVWGSLREKMVPEKYVRLIQEMYREVRTKVRTSVGERGV